MIVKSKEAHHKFTGREYSNSSVGKIKREILLVGSGKNACLWVGETYPQEDFWKKIVIFSGPKTLRALAKAILKAIPE